MTIFALSSGPGLSGIAVIRVSGPNTKNVLKNMTISPIPSPKVAVVRKFINPKTREIIDEGILLWLPGPDSYTGEDMAEFHVHGSKAVIEAMSCEIPLIATNVSAIPELTSNYAKLVEPKNSEMISNSAKEIFSNYPKYIEIAKKGRQHVIQNFNWIKITEEYEKGISKTIEEFNNANF